MEKYGLLFKASAVIGTFNSVFVNGVSCSVDSMLVSMLQRKFKLSNDKIAELFEEAVQARRLGCYINFTQDANDSACAFLY